jgi:sugar lactone lactonase YvrE
MDTSTNSPSRSQPDWRSLTEPLSSLGEVPVYDARNASLYWIDVFGPSLFRTPWDGGTTQTWKLPSTVGSYALSSDPAMLVVALHDGIYEFDMVSGQLELRAAAPYDMRHQRFNDGRTDPQGNFWAGTIRLLDSEEPDGRGHFYKYSRGALTQEIGGVTTANGIAFSPDGQTMYLADRVNARILAYDFDGDTSSASGERIFVELDPRDIPDGAAVDVEGGYWIAMFGSGEVRRYSPDGTLDRVLALPVSRPTMCAFAGPDRGTLVVTTARWGMMTEELAHEPLAGAVLAADVGIAGISEPLYVAAASGTAGTDRREQ